MGLSLLDTILNVCRTPYDVLHIFLYLILLFIAFLVAFYKFDKDLFSKHVYIPYLNFFLVCEFISNTPKLRLKKLI